MEVIMKKVMSILILGLCSCSSFQASRELSSIPVSGVLYCGNPGSSGAQVDFRLDGGFLVFERADGSEQSLKTSKSFQSVFSELRDKGSSTFLANKSGKFDEIQITDTVLVSLEKNKRD